MRTYDAKTKTLTSRTIGHGPVLLISDQGDICNYETTIWRGDRRPRRWVSVDTSGQVPKSALILRGDSLSLKGDDVLVRTGTKTTKLKGEAIGSPHQSTQKPEGPSFTVDAWRGENREAMKALQVALSLDETVPILNVLNLRSENGAIKAYSTDRYKLTEAVLHTVSKKVDFVANVPGFLLRELTVNRAWHLTVWEDYSLAEFCDTGVRVQTMNRKGDFPKVETLFAEYPPEHTATLKVTPSLFSKVIRDLNPPRHQPVALSRDGLVGAEGSGHIRPAGVVEAKYRGNAAKWIALNGEYVTRMLRSVSAYPEVRIEWGENEMKPVYFNVSDRVRMLLMPTRGAGRSFPVSDIFEG